MCRLNDCSESNGIQCEIVLLGMSKDSLWCWQGEVEEKIGCSPGCTAWEDLLYILKIEVASEKCDDCIIVCLKMRMYWNPTVV